MPNLGPFEITLRGGPLDGEELKWMWNDDEDGHLGAESGIILMERVAYQCNEERTEATYLAALYFRLVGGPFDGAEMSGIPHNPTDLLDMPIEGEVKFGGLVYWLDRRTGVATYRSGRDETGALKKMTGMIEGRIDPPGADGN